MNISYWRVQGTMAPFSLATLSKLLPNIPVCPEPWNKLFSKDQAWSFDQPKVQVWSLTLNRASVGIYALTVLYCTELYSHWLFPKYHVEGYVLNKFYKIIILIISLVIYQQVQILTSQSIFSICPKIQSLWNLLHQFWVNGLEIPHRIMPVGIGLFLDVVEACTGHGHICPHAIDSVIIKGHLIKG